MNLYFRILSAFLGMTASKCNTQVNRAKQLYELGELNTILVEFKDSKEQEIVKIVECAGKILELLKKNDLNVSINEINSTKDSFIFRGFLKRLMIENKSSFIFRAAKSFGKPNDSEGKLIIAHAMLFTGKFYEGCQMLSSLGYKTLENDFNHLLRAYKMQKDSFDSLKKIYKEIEEVEKKYNYVPSMFSYLKYQLVLTDMVKKGIELKSAACEPYAEILMNKVNDDDTKVLYYKSMLYGRKTVEEIKKWLENAKFVNADRRVVYLRDLEVQAKEKEKREEEEAKNAEEKKGEGPANDPLWYYDALGVSPKADLKTIKDAFADLNRKINIRGSEMGSAEYKRKTAQLARINKAYDVLRNRKTRAQYDSGETTRPGMGSRGSGQHGRHAEEELAKVFKMFFGGGGGSFGGGSSSPRRGGGYARTYRFG